MDYSTNLLPLLASFMLIFSFFVLSRMRLVSLLRMYAWQSALLAAYAFSSAFILNEAHLMITAALTLLLKAIFLPRYFLHIAERGKAIHRLESYWRPTTMSFMGGLLILIAFVLAWKLVPIPAGGYLITAVALSMVFHGLFMLVIRKDLFGQMIGFLVVENGIFTFGLALTGGMPLMVEIGVFFDVMVGSVLMAALLLLVQKEKSGLGTDRLKELID